MDSPATSTPISTTIVGSCNGLICIIIDMNQKYIWNPSTRKSKKLLDSAFTRMQHNYTMYGFGYESTNDDYNVVHISHALDLAKIETKVYSMKTDTWRRIDDFPGLLPCYSWGKYVNGKLHWAGYSGDKDRGIISFDLIEAEYRKVKLPTRGERAWSPTLGALGRCLCVTYEYHNSGTLDLWLLKEYEMKEPWTKVLYFPSFCPRNPMPLWISLSYPKVMNMEYYIAQVQPSMWRALFLQMQVTKKKWKH